MSNKNKFSNGCEHCQEFMLEYMDEALPTEQTAAIAKHLNECSACAHLYDEQETLSRFLAGGMKEIASSLSMPPITIRPPKPSVWMLRRIAAILVLILVPLAIWLMVSAPSEPGNSGVPDSRLTAHHVQTPSDVMLSDSLSDWHDRRLVITFSDEEGNVTKRIVTSN